MGDHKTEQGGGGEELKEEIKETWEEDREEDKKLKETERDVKRNRGEEKRRNEEEFSLYFLPSQPPALFLFSVKR